MGGRRRTLKNRFNLGDVVRMECDGACYTTYRDAIDYFNLLNVKTNSYWHDKEVIIPENFDKINWVIINKVIHGNGNAILYCLENAKGERIISGDDYFKLRSNVNNKLTDFLKKKNENFNIESLRKI